MIDPKQIPDEVVEAAAKTLMDPDYPNSWPAWMDEARAAIAAALNAWPGALHSPDEVIDGELLPPIISLPFPLPQEKQDE